MPEFVVEISDHDGNLVAELENPTGLQYKFQIGAEGPGLCQWSMAEDDPVVLAVDDVATMPKIGDWKLLMEGSPVMAGVVDSVNMPLDGDEISVIGKEWLEWLNQDWRDYYGPPFDYADDLTTVIEGAIPDEFHILFEPGSTVQDVVEGILGPLSQDAAEQIILNPVFLGSAWGEELVGNLARAHGRTALSLIQDLAAMGSPYGFDFWTEWNKTLNMIGPRKTDPLAVFPIAIMTQDSGWFMGDSFDESPIVDGDWTNNGPLGTDVLFLDGTGNVVNYFRKQHQPSVDQFRRWGASAVTEGGEPWIIGLNTETEFKAQAASYRMLFPQRELTLTVKPELFSWRNQLLEPIQVDYTKFPGAYRRIDASFWITSQTYRETEPGSNDWVCDLTLDQIYIPID